jgi:hypothetical protein
MLAEPTAGWKDADSTPFQLLCGNHRTMLLFRLLAKNTD